MGVSSRSGSSSIMRAVRVTVPVVPSSRSNTARDGCRWSAARPAARSTAVTLVKLMTWFFGENASIEGGITETRRGSRPSHAYAGRENT